MEVTRRRLMGVLLGAAAAVGAGLGWVGRKAAPRRLVRAVRLSKYPGDVVPMGDITRQSKWSG